MHSSYSWVVLMPPLVTLIAAFFTKKIAPSLLLGIITAAFIIGRCSVDMTLMITTARLWGTTQLGNLFTGTGPLNNLYMFIFLLMLGILVALISYTGGSCAYERTIRPRLKNARAAESASLILSLTLFIDDYLSSLTVGCTMHPLTDRFKIPRAKLSYLIDSMAAPLTILMPVSSWVAVITGQLQQSGITDNVSAHPIIFADPFYVYTQIIPYIFYSFITIITAWFIVRKRISFGSMATHEQIAQETGNLFGGKKPLQTKIMCRETANSSLFDFIAPIILLVICVVVGLLRSGGYILFGGHTHSITRALQTADIFSVLFSAGLITLLASFITALYREKILMHEIPSIAKRGLQIMGPSVIILILAWTLSDLLKTHLHTGEYLAYLFLGSINVAVLPFMLFVASLIISITIGSSWGTALIMIPLAIPMLLSFLHIHPPVSLAHVPQLFVTLGAILSGAVAGDHVSPISDTTIMSSTSSGSYHLDHVQTQWTYAIPVIIGTGLAFLIAGYIQPVVTYWAAALISGIVGISTSLIILSVMNKREKRKE